VIKHHPITGRQDVLTAVFSDVQSTHCNYFTLLCNKEISSTEDFILGYKLNLDYIFIQLGCHGVQIWVGTLSDSDNFWQIQNPTRSQSDSDSAFVVQAQPHHSSQSAAIHAEVNKCTLNSCLLTSVQTKHRIGRELLVWFRVMHA